MPVSSRHWKVHNYALNACQRQRQYIYNHCQLSSMTPGHALIVSVCIVMLPMLGLASEHVQLKTTYHINAVNKMYIYPCHMSFHHTTLVLPSLNNVLPAMVLQNRVVKLNIGCRFHFSSYFSVQHVSSSWVYFCLGRKVVGMVVFLLLLLSGDIELNPGPLGEYPHQFKTFLHATYCT